MLGLKVLSVCTAWLGDSCRRGYDNTLHMVIFISVDIALQFNMHSSAAGNARQGNKAPAPAPATAHSCPCALKAKCQPKLWGSICVLLEGRSWAEDSGGWKSRQTPVQKDGSCRGEGVRAQVQRRAQEHSQLKNICLYFVVLHEGESCEHPQERNCSRSACRQAGSQHHRCRKGQALPPGCL